MSLTINENVPLAPYTTLKVGGVAAYMATVESVEELRAALQFAKQTEVPPLTLAGGSNLLISDAGYPGLVIKMNLKGRDYAIGGDTCELRVAAGEVLDVVIAETVERGWWGLENLSAIPGSVGATPVQNVGAYGVEVADVIISVEAINSETGEEKIFSNEACAFSYRSSYFKTEEGRGWIITAVTFRLSKVPHPKLEYADLRMLKEEGDSVSIQLVRDTVIKIRESKFPDWRVVGTAGSFFKNPIITNDQFENLKQLFPELPGYPEDADTVKVSLGWILDKVCNLKGYCDGPVCLFKKQALVLVNNGGATASEIKIFEDYIKEKVFERTQIPIESEVVHVMI